ncbi:MAG: hypothetical protein COB02_18180, partial [Candidatus Cloacimonadota bacterium]
NGHSSYTAKSKINKGVYISPVYSAPDYNLSSNGDVNLLPIAMISRNRNQGAYHPEYNSGGSKKFIDDKFHNDTAQVITSTADCFDISKILVASGNIASGKSGRPDSLYYDEINERDVRDLRLPTNYSKNVDTELSECISATKRGYEAEFEITEILDRVVSNTYYWTGNPVGPCVTVGLTVTSGVVSGNQNYLSNDLRAFILGNDGKYYELYFVNGAVVYTHPRYGNTSAVLPDAFATKIVISVRTDRYSNNTITRCEIIGDPSNYTAPHVGVANLINVNSGASQLPSDIATTSNWKVFLLTKLEKLNNGYVSKILIDGNILTYDYYCNNNLAKTYYLVPNTRLLRINWTNTYVSLGYASEADMADNCVIEVYYGGYADDLILSVREEVQNLILSDVIAISSAYATEGSKLLANLISKIATNTTATSLMSKTLLTKFIYPSSSKMTSSDSNRAPSHDAFSLYNTSKPSIKLILYQTEKDGLLYNVIVFKEMKFDGDWGDDQKFDITDNIKTKTDDNGNVIIYGTVISQNPVGFAKE